MLFLQPFAQDQNFCENPWKFSKTRILIQILAFLSNIVFVLKVCSIPNNRVMACEFRSIFCLVDQSLLIQGKGIVCFFFFQRTENEKYILKSSDDLSEVGMEF